jgi:hypothetical protein
MTLKGNLMGLVKGKSVLAKKLTLLSAMTEVVYSPNVHTGWVLIAAW